MELAEKSGKFTLNMKQRIFMVKSSNVPTFHAHFVSSDSSFFFPFRQTSTSEKCVLIFEEALRTFIRHKSQNWSHLPLGNATFRSLFLSFSYYRILFLTPCYHWRTPNDFIKMGCTSWEINGFFQIKYFCIIILIRNMVGTIFAFLSEICFFFILPFIESYKFNYSKTSPILSIKERGISLEKCERLFKKKRLSMVAISKTLRTFNGKPYEL